MTRLGRLRSASPHLVLAVSAAAVLGLESLRGSATLDTSAVWPVAQALVAGTALLVVWGSRDRLRLGPILLLGLAFHLGWIALHLYLGVEGDHDPVDVYPQQGDVLLHGDYPRSEYPPGAVALFAVETWLGGGEARTANAFLMVPFQLVCVAAIWALRTPWTPWLAAFVALWPLNAFYWEFRFDLAPTAALVVGLLLARRGRWYEAGFVLGLGTVAKWTPALALVPLLLWLLRTRRFEKAGFHLLGFAVPVLLVHLPLLLWKPSEVLAAYTTQNERVVTAESFVFLPLHFLWDAEPGYWYFGAADVSDEANRNAVAFQIVAVVGVVALAALARTRSAAVALAGLTPAVFLLTNRIFSPQFYVLVLAAMIVAAALVVGRRSELFLVMGALAVATTANTVLFQLLGAQPVETVPGWMWVSGAAFVPTFSAAIWLAMRGGLEGRRAWLPEPAALRAALGQGAVGSPGYRGRPVTLPGWIAGALRWGFGVLAGLFAIAALFAAVVMPYRFWDSLAFGSWSRTIAEGGDLWDGQPALYLQRPLFYLEQGLAWRVLDDEWIGRLLSLSFGVVLAVAVWILARRLVPDEDARRILPPLAAAVVLASPVYATYVAAGMTDVPVAAMAAATGAALLIERLGPGRLLLVGALAAGTVLAKPTGLLALAGLAAAAAVLHGWRSLRGLAALGAGVAIALAYDVWQASRLDDSVSDFLSAGNDAFWRERGEAARWDALARAEWLGAGLRLVVLFGLAHAVARVAGARTRVALAIGAGVAIVWSLAGPLLADGDAPYPFDGTVLGLAAWIVLAAAMVAAPFFAEHDVLSRRTHAALLLWLAPMAVAWAWQRADETRHLAPAWAPLALVTAAGLVSLTVPLARARRPAATLAPAAAVALLVLLNLPSIDGLGRGGWRGLLELGRDGWTSTAERENYAYGPFSYELNAARENVGDDERIVSSNGRLSYFFPGRVEIAYARTCAELDGKRFFSFLTSGESLEFAQLEGQPTDPLAWLQCASPRVTMVSEQEGIYAAYVVGDPPARTPVPEDCRIAPAGGQDVDAIFGDGLTYEEAKALRERAYAIGYTGGLRLERTGCSTFRVVVTGLPEDDAMHADFRREAKRNGFDVTYAPGTRFPEVPIDVAAVP